MKLPKLLMLMAALSLAGIMRAETEPVDLTSNFVVGDPAIQSMHALAFGPQAILFIGDSRSAEIIALETGDLEAMDMSEGVSMENVDEQLAARLGTTVEDITITDMAVNPESKAIYFSVHLRDGTPVLVRTDGKNMEIMAMEKVSYAKISLEDAVAEDAVDGRDRPLRQWAVSDLAYHDGQVMVSGLSNAEFSSTFRSIPFPFNDDQMYASLEIFHAAHGRYETYAPIKTFMPYEIGGKAHLVASYTCTPLVIFPLDEMAPGKHVKGHTVAELGNRNTPLDFVSYEKDGKGYLLLANSSRALMKIDPEKIGSFSDYLTEPVEGNSMAAGVEFIALPYVHVQQMDKLSETQIVMLQLSDNGELNLHTVENSRL